MRRPLLAFGLSVAIHAAAAAMVVGFGLWQGLMIQRPVEFEVVSVTPEVKDLPLGPQPGAPRRDGPPAARPHRRFKDVTGAGTVPTPSADAGASDAGAPDGAGPDTGRPKPGDLRAYGPEGSRLTALLRLDRLRAVPEAAAYTAAVDQLLQLLPDRRRLIEGTGLDLYRDFDALLVATPNPLDDAVTFLAARHHLKDDELQTALQRGGSSVGRPIVWGEQGGRPVATRGVRPTTATDPVAVPARDDRIIVLPQPGLAIIAPPAYAQLLLAGHAPGAAVADGGRPGPDWRQLVARIDAEDGAMPGDAVVVMTAANLLHGTAAGPQTVPTTRGTVDDMPIALGTTGNGGLPAVASLVMGLAPAPYIELTAEFADENAAKAWEVEWPSLKRKALGNPLLLLGGLAPLVARAELRREDHIIIVRTTSTTEEALRILQMAATLTRGRAGL